LNFGFGILVLWYFGILVLWYFVIILNFGFGISNYKSYYR